MSIADKILALKDDFDNVFAAGERAKDAEWQSKVYTGYTSFNDTNSITVELPFMPDRLFIASLDALVMSTPLTYSMLTFDRSSFSDKCAVMNLVDGNLTARFAFISNETRDTFFTVNGNSVTFTPPQSSYYGTSVWRSGAKYLVLAYCSGKTDKERLISEVAALGSGGGSIAFSKNRVMEVLTPTEWEELIAPKRAMGWTFALIQGETL